MRTATRAGSELQGLAGNLDSTRRVLRRPVGGGQAGSEARRYFLNAPVL